jgi:hypothetical protein
VPLTRTFPGALRLRKFTPVLKILNLRSRVSRLIAGIGGTAAAVISLVLGLHNARQASAPVIQPQSDVIAGQWLVRLGSVDLRERLPDGRVLPSGQKALTVDATLTNRTHSSSGDVHSLIHLITPALDNRAKPSFYLMRDAALLDQLHPDMSERVAIVWTVPVSTGPHSPVTLGIEAKSYKSRDNLYAAPGWFNPETVGIVTLTPSRVDTSGL